MKRGPLAWLLPWSLLHSGVSVVVYFTEGQTLILRPDFRDVIKNIEWKRNRNFVAEWMESAEAPTYFRDRLSLDLVNGSLIVADAVAADEGNYTLVLNDVLQDEDFIVKFIRPVPEPEVHVSPLACSSESESCTLRCEGDTSGAQPVTYLWRTEPGTEMAPGESHMVINGTDNLVGSFVCAMKNPLGLKESKPFTNPFYQKPPDDGLGAGAIAGLVLFVLGVLIALALCFRFWTKKRGDVTINGAERRADGGTELPENEKLNRDP
ncbi:uncharacterized protein LOC133509448 [Syngnathoides biaculeatus]|uniref:uncharacterized protein LOC133509448 n=1 Tax=Syngnathoides biaculeatus TaxID=300417 RepID=UPI002ADE1BF1|nr:uncharacterized protein LOC133509448 [Syngnathoides biaculeatus]